jgi:hypothetical protein
VSLPPPAHNHAADDPSRRLDARAAWVAALYYLAYLIYLSFHQEGEILHWLSLVAVPLAILAALYLNRMPDFG